MIKLNIHPLTIPSFVLMHLLGMSERFLPLYIFALFHECAHLLTSVLLGEKIKSFSLYPWGCMLILQTLPNRRKSLAIFLSGPLFNLVLFLLGIYPKENISLALFNLIPVAPLDGGMLINLLFPSAAPAISVLFILLLTLSSFYLKAPFFLPAVLAFLFILGEKTKLDKTLASRILEHFRSK